MVGVHVQAVLTLLRLPSWQSMLYVTTIDEVDAAIKTVAGQPEPHKDLTIIVSGAHHHFHFNILSQGPICTLNIFTADPSSSPIPLILDRSFTVGRYRLDE